MGGAVFVSTRDNTTHAVVEDDAKVYSGADGGFNMKAEEAMLVVNLAQSGASGGDYVLAGSVAVTNQDSDTLVQLGSTAARHGPRRAALCRRPDDERQLGGRHRRGESLGVGFSIAINEFDRKTRAVIGDPDARDRRFTRGGNYHRRHRQGRRPRQGGRRSVGFLHRGCGRRPRRRMAAVSR